MTYVIEMPVLNASSSDPDQTPRSAASDLCLHCLLMLFFVVLGIKGLHLKSQQILFFVFSRDK